MGKNTTAKTTGLNGHFAYFIYKQGATIKYTYMGLVISVLGCVLIN